MCGGVRVLRTTEKLETSDFRPQRTATLMSKQRQTVGQRYEPAPFRDRPQLTTQAGNDSQWLSEQDGTAQLARLFAPSELDLGAFAAAIRQLLRSSSPLQVSRPAYRPSDLRSSARRVSHVV